MHKTIPCLKLFCAAVLATACCFTAVYGATAEKSDFDFILLGTSDTQGTLMPIANDKSCGGYARISAAIKNVKQKYPQVPVMVVSAGDDFMDRFFKHYKGHAIVSVMTKMGYAFACPGNHEFDYGAEVFAEAIKQSGTTYITSDLETQNTPLAGNCVKSAVVDAGKLKVGMFSLMTSDISMISSSAPVRQTAGNLETAAAMCSELKAQGADLILCLSHTGLENDIEVARNVKDIDLIFGGHSHAYLDTPEIIGKTVILNGGHLGKKLVCYKVALNKNGSINTRNSVYELIDINTDIPPDEETERMVNHFNAHLPGGVVLGQTLEGWDLADHLVRTGQSKAARMICAIVRQQLNTDIFFTNAGAIRGTGEYPAGIITDTMLSQIDEFENYIYRFRIKGKYLKPILERGAANWAEGGFILASGITWDINLSAPAQVLEKREQGYSVVRRGQRVNNVMVGAEPINPDAFYTVATNSFLFDRAGDGFFWFEKYGKQVDNTGKSLLEIIQDQLAKTRTLDPSRFLRGKLKAA